jgi:hypothetical protein
MIKIDVKVNKKLFRKAPEAVRNAYRDGLAGLTNAAYNEWQKVAGQNLTTTASDYKRSIKSPVKINEDSYVIELSSGDKKKNWLVTAIEAGISSYSIKDILLKSPKAFTHASGPKAGQPKVGAPWLNIPLKPRGGGIKWVRLTEQSTGKFNWMHPGFQPDGGPSQHDPVNLGTPYREVVIEYVKKEAENTFKPFVDKIKL